MEMIYCRQVFKKRFEHKVSKKAYLNACKWLAMNIYNNVELANHIVVQITKDVQEEQSPAFVVSVYVKDNEKDLRSDFCKRCKSLHTIFYSVEGMDCNKCKAMAYFKKEDKDIEGKTQFVKRVLEDKENEK